MAMLFQKSVLTYTFLDTSGEKVTRSYEMHSGDLNYVVAVGGNLHSDILQLTDASIIGREVKVVYVDSAATVPVAANNKQVLLVSDFLKGDPTSRGYLSIPAPKNSLFTQSIGEGHNIMKWPQAQVQQFLKSFVSEADGGYGNLFLSDGETLTLTDVVGRRVSRHRR